MNISFLHAKKNTKSFLSEQQKRLAFHVAGQVASIYLRNKRMHLPSVYFRVLIKHAQPRQQHSVFMTTQNRRYQIKIEGGRLIKDLTTSLIKDVNKPNNPQQQHYLQYFNADIINILAGPVAEARYIGESNNEIITPRLVNFTALGFYNDMNEMATILNYLQSRKLSAAEQQKTMINLYLTSFCFVGEEPVWRAIDELANYFLTTQQTIFESGEIGAVLDGIKPKLASVLTG